jgi:hypothetical protein
VKLALTAENATAGNGTRLSMAGKIVVPMTNLTSNLNVEAGYAYRNGFEE